MEVFSKLKCENPGSFFDLKIKLVSMVLTDAGAPKEVVEGFVRRLKKAKKPDGSFLEQFLLCIKNKLRRLYSPANSPAELAGPEPIFEEVSAELANCCALIYDPLRHVPDLEYRADHPWTMEELGSAIEKEIIKHLFDLVEFSLNQVGMAEEAKEFKVQVAAAGAGVENFQSVKLCKEMMLQIESRKVEVILTAVIPIPEEDVYLPALHSSFVTPPLNWKPDASATMAGRNDKVTEAVTVAVAVDVAEGSGSKRKAAADAGGGRPSSLKTLKLF